VIITSSLHSVRQSVGSLSAKLFKSFFVRVGSAVHVDEISPTSPPMIMDLRPTTQRHMSLGLHRPMFLNIILICFGCPFWFLLKFLALDRGRHRNSQPACPTSCEVGKHLGRGQRENTPTAVSTPFLFSAHTRLHFLLLFPSHLRPFPPSYPAPSSLSAPSKLLGQEQAQPESASPHGRPLALPIPRALELHCPPLFLHQIPNRNKNMQAVVSLRCKKKRNAAEC
jgi:hypothetical protein